MIPLRDDVPSRTTPFVTVALIALNVLVFLYQLMLGPQLRLLYREFAVIPVLYFRDHYLGPGGGPVPVETADLLIPLVTSMFLHGGWLHLIGNMVYLWIFGDNVEDRMGHGRYVVFYLLCGLSASGAHILTNVNSTVPSLGASGAIAGVLGAYLLLFPGAKIMTLVPLGFFLDTIELPAVGFLGLWFAIQWIQGLKTIGQLADVGGVAFWAHIGGFLSGMAWVLVRRRRARW